MANNGGLTSTADLESLHRKRRVRTRDFRSISGTGTISLLVPLLPSDVRAKLLQRRPANIGKRGTSVVILCRGSLRGGEAHELSAMGRKPSPRVSMAMVRPMPCRRDPGHNGARRVCRTKAQGEYRMNCPRPFRLAMVALVPVAAISLGFAAAWPNRRHRRPPPAAATPATPAAPRLPGSVGEPHRPRPPLRRQPRQRPRRRHDRPRRSRRRIRSARKSRWRRRRSSFSRAPPTGIRRSTP